MRKIDRLAAGQKSLGEAMDYGNMPASVHKYQPGLPIFPANHVVATQCISCGHVEAPAADPAKCAGCGAIGDDVRVFPALLIDTEDAEKIYLG